jgi:hypothetical protein
LKIPHHPHNLRSELIKIVEMLKMRKKLLSDDTVKMVRWLLNNTKLSSSEISSYYECTYDVRICYDVINKIKHGTRYQEVDGEINIDSCDLQKYICLCYPPTFMECKMPYITGGKCYKNEPFKIDGPIEGYRLKRYEISKKIGLI